MSHLPDEFIQRVNEATDIVALVSQTVALRKQGAEFVGLCPFHNEKSPSFGVSPSKGLFLCRGCGAGGNAIQFLQQTQGLPFRDAVLDLAARASLPIPAPTAYSPQARRDNEQIERLQPILAMACQAYQLELRRNPQAQQYLASRGVTPEVAERFGIGYAPRGGGALREHLRGVSETDLVDAGLLYRSEYAEGRMAEWLNHRVVFPVFNASGRPIAFGGRSLVPDAKRKYINTPETVLFKKSQELYGLHHAAPAIRRENAVIVAEGYLDSVVPSGHGVGNIVSAMGTAFGPDNLRRLFKMADTAIFCFDGDAAGRRAALRTLEFAAEQVDEKKRCRFAFLPEGMDPDDFVRAKGGEAFRSLISHAEPMSKYLVREFSERNDMTCAEGKASFARDAMDIVERISSPTLKALLIDDVRQAIGPNIPLPGVTPGTPAVIPVRTVAPVRSAVRMREPKPRMAPASSAEAPPASPAVQGVATALAPAATPPAATVPPQAAPGPLETPATLAAPGAAVRLQLRKPGTMAAVARQASDEPPPSQALRFIAFVLRDPRLVPETGLGVVAAAHFSGCAEEIDALDEIATALQREPGAPPPTSDDLLRTIGAGRCAAVVGRATQTLEFLAQDLNVIVEGAAIMQAVASKVARAQRAKRLQFARPR